MKLWKGPSAVKLLSPIPLFVMPGTVAHQAPPSMEFSRQEYWSGLPFPSPGESSWPGDQIRVSRIAGRHYHLSHQGIPFFSFFPFSRQLVELCFYDLSILVSESSGMLVKIQIARCYALPPGCASLGLDPGISILNKNPRWLLAQKCWRTCIPEKRNFYARNSPSWPSTEQFSNWALGFCRVASGVNSKASQSSNPLNSTFGGFWLMLQKSIHFSKMLAN